MNVLHSGRALMAASRAPLLGRSITNNNSSKSRLLSTISHLRLRNSNNIPIARTIVPILSLRSSTTIPLQYNHPQPSYQRTFIAAPSAPEGPLLERRADRPLPDLRPRLTRSLPYTLPLFLLAIGISTLLIFNYQLLSSPVISSTLYSLRTSPFARQHLGDEIQLAGRPVQWIYGELDQLHGKVDVSYYVKGKKGDGWARFKCVREGGRNGLFRTERWELHVKDEEGREETVDLLREEGGVDPSRVLE